MADIRIPKIRFIDLSELEERARQQLTNDIGRIDKRKEKTGSLSAFDQAELARLIALRDAAEPKYLDPLFATTRAAFADNDSELRPITIDHQQGVLTANGAVAARAAKTRGSSRDANITRVALVLGLLQQSKTKLPPLVVDAAGDVVPDAQHPNSSAFAEAFYRAIGRAAGHLDLAMRVLRLVADAVDIRGDGQEPKVSSMEYARVVEKLIDLGVQSTDANLKRHVDEALDRVQESGEEKPEHEIAINLPDLEKTTDLQVVEDNIRLIGPMIFASMFDELKAFQVVDKLIEMSQRGELSLIRGKAGTRLYNYWRQAPNRMSETERQTFYAITLGLPTGPPGAAINREFPDLWIRFVSSVTALTRENRVDQIIRSTLPIAINQQQVKKSARDLTANMSLYGYGMAYYAAVDLQNQINEMIELLGDSELRAAFGARDMWGVIDHIAHVELGGARNSSKYRTLATCCAIITSWLANNIDRVRDATRPMIDLREVEHPPSRATGQTATSHPTDYDLVNACELWLADSAMTDERVEELAQPRESPQQPSRPIQIPSFARDLLEGTGLGFQMAAPNAGLAVRPGGKTNGRAGTPYPAY
jgi:hypothetical protein